MNIANQILFAVVITSVTGTAAYIGLGVTVALIPFDSGSVAGADEFSGRKLLKLVLDGTKFLPVAVAGSEDLCV